MITREIVYNTENCLIYKVKMNNIVRYYSLEDPKHSSKIIRSDRNCVRLVLDIAKTGGLELLATENIFTQMRDAGLLRI